MAAARTRKRHMPGRNIELGKIHKAAAELGMIQRGDDATYRTMLWTVARVRSAADLDATGRQKVLEHLRACGWTDPRPFVRRRSGDNLQALKIKDLWDKLAAADKLEDSSERALRAYVQKQSAPYHPQRAGYSAPELLPAPVAQRVIEHLKHWCRRTGVEV